MLFNLFKHPIHELIVRHATYFSVNYLALHECRDPTAIKEACLSDSGDFSRFYRHLGGSTLARIRVEPQKHVLANTEHYFPLRRIGENCINT